MHETIRHNEGTQPKNGRDNGTWAYYTRRSHFYCEKQLASFAFGNTMKVIVSGAKFMVPDLNRDPAILGKVPSGAAFSSLPLRETVLLSTSGAESEYRSPASGSCNVSSDVESRFRIRRATPPLASFAHWA